MKMRSMSIEVIYQGVSITYDIAEDITGFTFDDKADGSSDSISLSLRDPGKKWLNGWYPDAGAKIEAAITLHDWAHEGDTQVLECGTFIIDNPSFSGEGTKVTLNAVSKPANSSFNETKKTHTWESVTIQQIASNVAKSAGVSLEYDADEIKIEKIEQNDTDDGAFLADVCKKYGLILKVYSDKLIIFDRERYKAKPAVATIDITDMSQWSSSPELQGTYTGGEIAYTNGKAEKELIYKTGKAGRWYKSTERVDNLADAERKLKSAIAEANHKIMPLTFTTMFRADVFAGQCVNVVGLGTLDGKYYINSLKHTFGGTTSWDCSKVF